MDGEADERGAHPVKQQDAAGDAAAASAAIERWLAERSRPTPPAEAPFLALRKALEAICGAPAIQDDPACTALLAEIAMADSMEAVVEALDRLEARTDLMTRTERKIASSRAASGRRIRTLLRL